MSPDTRGFIPSNAQDRRGAQPQVLERIKKISSEASANRTRLHAPCSAKTSQPEIKIKLGWRDAALTLPPARAEVQVKIFVERRSQ
jgi:hypothetical protein